MTEEEIYAGLYDNTVLGRAGEVKALTQAGLDLNMDPVRLLYGALLPALQEVGRRFEIGDFFVPEMLMSARAMQAALTLLRPLLAARGEKTLAKYVMGTVKGDVHDIGKNLCNIMLEGGGFEVIDLGADVSPEKFVDAIKANRANLVCLSALLTVTMPSMKTTIEALKQAGLREQGKVMIGGAPVTQQYADEIGADAYGENATAAVSFARKLVAN